MNRAFIFPGQGSQLVGMGKDFFEQMDVVKDLYKQVDNELGYELSDIIFSGTMEQLSSTIHTQPAIMLTSMVILTAILNKSGKKIDQLCSIVAGHSLGEYSALCAAGFMDLKQCAKLLQIRASAMHESSLRQNSGMAACLGIETSDLQSVIDSTIKGGVCQIANDNIKGQLVVSGNIENIDLLIGSLKQRRCKAIKLKVSAGFHCSLMKEAEEKMAQALKDESFKSPNVPIISNYSASLEDDIATITHNLEKQICGRVRWRETMDQLAKQGITELVEVGPGKVLSNLAKKSGHDFRVVSISNIEEMVEFLEALD